MAVLPMTTSETVDASPKANMEKPDDIPWLRMKNTTKIHMIVQSPRMAQAADIPSIATAAGVSVGTDELFLVSLQGPQILGIIPSWTDLSLFLLWR